MEYPGLGNRPRRTAAPGTSGDTYTITGVAPGTYWFVAYRNGGELPDPGLSLARGCLPPNLTRRAVSEHQPRAGHGDIWPDNDRHRHRHLGDAASAFADPPTATAMTELAPGVA